MLLVQSCIGSGVICLCTVCMTLQSVLHWYCVGIKNMTSISCFNIMSNVILGVHLSNVLDVILGVHLSNVLDVILHCRGTFV